MELPREDPTSRGAVSDRFEPSPGVNLIREDGRASG